MSDAETRERKGGLSDERGNGGLSDEGTSTREWIGGLSDKGGSRAERRLERRRDEEEADKTKETGQDEQLNLMA